MLKEALIKVTESFSRLSC